jgi:hypothetical protein
MPKLRALHKGSARKFGEAEKLFSTISEKDVSLQIR